VQRIALPILQSQTRQSACDCNYGVVQITARAHNPQARDEIAARLGRNGWHSDDFVLSMSSPGEEKPVRTILPSASERGRAGNRIVTFGLIGSYAI